MRSRAVATPVVARSCASVRARAASSSARERIAWLRSARSLRVSEPALGATSSAISAPTIAPSMNPSVNDELLSFLAISILLTSASALRPA